MATNISAATAAQGTGALVTVQVDGAGFQTVEHAGHTWAVMKRLCARFGLNAQAQQRRVERSAWAQDEEGISVTAKVAATGPDGKTYQYVGLRTDHIAQWADTLDINDIEIPEAREAIGRLQRMGAKVLDAAFRGSPVALVTADAAREAREYRDVFAELLESNREMLERTEVIGTRLRLMPTTEYLDGALEQKADKADVDAVAAQLRAEMDALREQFRRHDIETKGRRQPSRDAVRESLRVLLRFYGGLDPVDRTTRVANPDGTRAPGAVWDHNLDRSDPSAEHGWMTCEATNALLKEPGSPEREKFKAVFDEYQRLRRKAADEKTAAQLSLCLKPR